MDDADAHGPQRSPSGAQVTWASAIAHAACCSHASSRRRSSRATTCARGAAIGAAPSSSPRSSRSPRSASGSSMPSTSPIPSIEMRRFFVGQPLWAAGLLWTALPGARAVRPPLLAVDARVVVAPDGAAVARSARRTRHPLRRRPRPADHGRSAARAVTISAAAGTADAAAMPELRRTARHARRHRAHAATRSSTPCLNALFVVFGMVLLKMFVKREELAAGRGDRPLHRCWPRAASSTTDARREPSALAVHRMIIAIIVLTIQRLGLRRDDRCCSSSTSSTSTRRVTLDPSKWFFADSLLLIADSRRDRRLRVLRLARRRAAAGRRLLD